MGYYLNVLQQGEMYELNGQKLQFIERNGTHYYFFVCKMGEWTFRYEPTNEKVLFTSKELNYIKRFGTGNTNFGLKVAGKDKVFPRI